MPQLYAIVMPSATEKSHALLRLREMSEDYSHISESDAICPPRATQTLDALRTIVKESGNWTEYDKEFAQEILARKRAEIRVIMLPAYELAHALGARVVAVLCLSRELWENNVHSRSQSVSRLERDYEKIVASGAEVFDSRETLFERVHTIADISRHLVNV